MEFQGKREEMLNRVQHDTFRVRHDANAKRFVFCHPEPCPGLVSGLFRDLGFGSKELF